MPFTAAAQEPGSAGIEAYVFNKRTGRAIQNVAVTAQAAGARATAFTDENGFATIEVSVSETWTLSVQCKRGSKTVESTAPLYPTLRDGQLYQRNFYLRTGPVHKCDGLDVAGPDTADGR